MMSENETILQKLKSKQKEKLIKKPEIEKETNDETREVIEEKKSSIQMIFKTLNLEEKKRKIIEERNTNQEYDHWVKSQ